MLYELPYDRPPIALVDPDDLPFWTALGVDADGRHALVLGDRSTPAAAVVIAGSPPDLARFLDPHTGELPAALARIGAQIRVTAGAGESVAARPRPAPVQPAAGVALVALPHSGLRVPHRQLSVTGYRALPTADGVAFTATLRLDRTVVGTVQNEGRGGPSGFHTNGSPRFGNRDLRVFVAACRTETGQPATEEGVLDDLITEFLTAKRIRKVHQAGRCALRMMAVLPGGAAVADSYPVAEADAPAPTSRSQRTALAGQLLQQSPPAKGEWWQIWTGERWEDLTPRPTTASDGAQR